jgi:hypothetical protein
LGGSTLTSLTLVGARKMMMMGHYHENSRFFKALLSVSRKKAFLNIYMLDAGKFRHSIFLTSLNSANLWQGL